jgi:hypothetical protein
VWCASRNPIVRDRLRTVKLVVGYGASSDLIRASSRIGVHVLPHDFAIPRHLKHAPGLALADQRIAVREAAGRAYMSAPERPVGLPRILASVLSHDLLLDGINFQHSRAASQRYRHGRIPRFSLVVEHKQIASSG